MWKPRYFKQQKINNKELYDLQEEIGELKKFLLKGKNFDLAKIVNFINNGIGANEMYLHQLAQMLNEAAEVLGLDFHWEVVDNPADLPRVLKNCKNISAENVLAYDMSRSGTTTEPGDFMEMTMGRQAGLYINKRIVWANGERFHKLGERLAKEDPQAAVLHIDNTPTNIGGRHMNLKTGMVYGPLLVALSIMGYKMLGNKKEAFAWAEEILKVYVRALYEANERLSPKQNDFTQAIDNPASHLATEYVRKRDVEKRNKLTMIFSPSLRNFATEYFQNTNEGVAKPAKGTERNNNMHSFWDASDESLDYMSVFAAYPELYQPIFIIDLSSSYATKMLEEVEQLKKINIPVKVVTLDLQKITKEEMLKILVHNLAVQAQATALLQTVVTTFTHLTDQDANSNPAVKMTREITKAIQDILVERKKKLARELTEEEKIVTFVDIQKQMQQTRDNDMGKARKTIGEKLSAIKEAELNLPEAFSAFADTLARLAERLAIDKAKLTTIFVESTSRLVFSADTAESGGLKSALVDAALEAVEFGKILGRGTEDFSLISLSKQVIAYEEPEKGIRISFACPEDLSPEKENSYRASTKEELAEAIAQYYYDRYLKTLNTFGVAYMDVDKGDSNITEIMEAVNMHLKKFGVNSLGIYLPRFAHTGIEAAQALPEIVAIIALLPTQSFPEENQGFGAVEIRDGMTVNDANKIYGVSNVVRMAFGGSATAMVEYRNSFQLSEIKNPILAGLKLFAQKLHSSSPVEAEDKQVSGIRDVAKIETNFLLPNLSGTSLDIGEILAGVNNLLDRALNKEVLEIEIPDAWVKRFNLGIGRASPGEILNKRFMEAGYLRAKDQKGIQEGKFDIVAEKRGSNTFKSLTLYVVLKFKTGSSPVDDVILSRLITPGIKKSWINSVFGKPKSASSAARLRRFTYALLTYLFLAFIVPIAGPLLRNHLFVFTPSIAYAQESKAYQGQDIKHWIKLLSYSDYDKREAAIEALIRIGEPAEKTLTELYLTSEDWFICRLAARILGEIPASEKVLIKLFESRDYKVRESAVKGLGKRGGPVAKEFLKKALSDEDSDVRKAAHQVLGEKEVFSVFISDLLSSAREDEYKAKRNLIITYTDKTNKQRVFTLLQVIASELKHRFNEKTQWFDNPQEAKKLRDLYYYVYENSEITSKELKAVPGFEYIEKYDRRKRGELIQDIGIGVFFIALTVITGLLIRRIFKTKSHDQTKTQPPYSSGSPTEDRDVSSSPMRGINPSDSFNRDSKIMINHFIGQVSPVLLKKHLTELPP